VNINQLAIFHAVAQEGNLTRASQKLCISQPAVSKQLRALEKTLGAALFHRLSSGVQLTESGTLLFEYSARIFALESEAEHALAELRGLQRGRLTIGASTTIGIYLLPEILGEFQKLHPGIELGLEIANTQAIQNALKDNALDVALTEGVLEGKEWQADIFMTDEIVVVAPCGHELSCARSLGLETICREPILVRETGSGTRAVIERVLRERGIPLQVSMSLGSTEALKRAVISGIGVAFISRLAVEAELQSGVLIALPMTEIIERPLHRLRLKGKYESRAAREFVRLLKTKKRGA
jgi:DNA-binding transcriptional LysR family regulator